jgi:CheY-like chemotaxis protein
MVYGIIQQHEGYIEVQSELGKGTLFSIYLPVMTTHVDETMPGIAHIMKGGTETVLVAEDDIHVRELTKEVLEGSGYNVLEATNGENALSVFDNSQDTINLLLLDVIMPKKNGKEVYETIRQKNQDIKAIFISGYDADIIQKKGVIDRGVNFVSKPVSPDELLYKVREVLDH